MPCRLWKIPDTDIEKAKILAAEYRISELAATVMVNRGYFAPFLAGRYLIDTPLQDPMEWQGMEKVVARIQSAIERGEKITVYGDYDCDGVTSTALLCDCILSLGGRVSAYLPNRLGEGYGMNQAALRRLAESGTKLIITVDNGISAVKEAQLLRELSIDLIITDHHQPGQTLPQALAVMDPHCKGSGAEYSDFAGVGVSLQLAAALLGDTETALKRYADLATIGTIADVMPMTSANRTIVKRGLKQLAATERPGIRALMQIAGMTPGNGITEEEVAFCLAPRINAAGRMADPRLALRLLTSSSQEEAEKLAEELQACNDRRKAAEQEILDRLTQQIQEDPALLQRRVLVFSGENWHHGVIGIVSAKMVEQYGKPCFLFSEENGILTGSGRSLGEFSLFHMLGFTKDLLIRYGGHKLAAGASLKKENLPRFMEAVEAYAASLPFLPRSVLACDAKLEPEELTVEAVSSLEVLRPFGAGNQPPVFCFENITVRRILPLSEGKHTKLLCSGQKSDFELLLFGTPTDRFPYRVGAVVDLAVTAKLHTFRGVMSVTIQAEDIRPARFSQKRYLRGLERYEAARYHMLTPEQCEDVLPGREQINLVYSVLKKTSLPVDADLLYFMLSDRLRYDTVCLSLDILYEAGVISGSALMRPLRLSQAPPKMALRETATYQMLLAETRGEASF